MTRNFIVCLLFLSISTITAQKQQFSRAIIGFYNFENLFDTINDPVLRDDEFTPEGSRLYTSEIYREKLNNLGKVVADIGRAQNPDGLAILGIAEIENRSVLEDFVDLAVFRGRDYKIIHFDSPDKRGIDVALIYQPRYFEPLSYEAIPYRPQRSNGDRVYTRDILYVSGLLHGDLIHVFVNHWPSRSGGEAVSAPLRNGAADLVQQHIDEILDKDPSAKILVMGDFNDDPNSASVRKHIRGVSRPDEISTNELYNPMIHMLKRGQGTLAWRDSWNIFDQILLSKGWFDAEGYQYEKAGIYKKLFMTQKKGRYKGYPFRTYGGSVYQGGYSDHFPVYVSLTSTDPGLLSEDRDIRTFDVSELVDQDNDDQDISSILTASRDQFINFASFTWSSTRFRIRGYDAENSTIAINGIEVNNVDDGRVFWNAWGGLNDVLRNREVTVGMAEHSYGLGGVGGLTNIDTRAANHRKQTRISYANSNRSYRHRLMATYSTGLQPNGWALSVSASRRMAQEGYVQGTPYDAYAYFVSLGRKLNDRHSLNLTTWGSKLDRGRGGPGATLEEYDLVGDNYYNPNWGWQAGKKRNSRLSKTFVPTAILNHDWSINHRGAELNTSLYYHIEQNGRTRIDWANARNPAANYYQKLPSFQTNDFIRDRMELIIRSNPDLLQVDWRTLYDANAIHNVTIQNANNSGMPFTGKQAQYIVENQRQDSRQLAAATELNLPVTDRYTIKARVDYTASKMDNYRLIDDLLGADFFLDIDNFVENKALAQTDLDNPNRLVLEGERYGYNYEIDYKSLNLSLQNVWILPRFDLHFGAQIGKKSYQRNGKYRNGLHPEDSKGLSELSSFNTFSAKAGITYKISGRQYIYANTMALSRAPFIRYAYAAPRVWNQLVPDLTNEKIYGAEIGYIFSAPGLKAKLVGYITDFKDGMNNTFFFDDTQATGGQDFINLVDQNVDKRHLGIESALELKVSPTLSVTAGAALGEYKYTSRIQSYVVNDDLQTLPETPLTVYSKNFYVAGTPQTALALGLNYRSPKYWFLNLTGSFYDDLYLDFSRIRRTQEFFDVLQIIETDPLLDYIVNQTKAPSSFSLDIFGGKSFRFGNKFVFFNVGINNILNDQNRITGGYEQSRWRVNDTTGQPIFGNRYFYGYGRNYFAQVALRM